MDGGGGKENWKKRATRDDEEERKKKYLLFVSPSFQSFINEPLFYCIVISNRQIQLAEKTERARKREKGLSPNREMEVVVMVGGGGDGSW